MVIMAFWHQEQRIMRAIIKKTLILQVKTDIVSAVFSSLAESYLC